MMPAARRFWMSSPQRSSSASSLAGMREALTFAMRRTDLPPRTGMMPASIGTSMPAA